MHDQMNHPSAANEQRHLQAAEAYLQQHRDRLQAALMTRLRSSVAAHREYTTVRREDLRWQAAAADAPALQTQCLRSNPQFVVELWQLEAGQALSWPEQAVALEVLVVAGALCTPDGQPGPNAQAYGYLVCDEAHQFTQWQALGPTRLYVRQRLVALQDLNPLEAHWWRLAAAQQGKLRKRRWSPTSPGARVMSLCGDTQVVSMLVRFDAGAAVPDHHHALDEDCLVLEGDMFLGDILLRAGDYQLAPQGGSHFGETSDGGVTFFFHGALDPVLL